MFDSLELFGERRGGRTYYLGAAALAVLAIAAFAAFSAVDETGAAGGIFLGGITILGITLLAFFAMGRPPAAATQRIANRDLLKALGESSPDALLILRNDGAVLYANPAYRELVGMTDPKRLVPLDRAFAGYPEISGPIYRLSKAVKSNGSDTETVLIPVEGGGTKRARISARPMDFAMNGIEPGGASLWQVAFLDGTDAPQAEAAGAVSHWLAQDALPCFSLDVQDRVTGSNKAARTLLGKGGSAALSGKYRDLFETIEAHGDGTFTATVTAKDGTQKTLALYVSPDGPGGTAGRIALVHDLTPAADNPVKQVEAPETPAGVLENAPIAIAWISKRGKVIHTNTACRNLLGEIAKKGRSITSLFDDGFQSDVRLAFEKALEGGEAHLPGEIRLSTQRDMFSQVSVLPAAIDPQADSEAAAILYLIDTTDQKSLEIQFAQSQKMQAVGQLAGGVAHDFNNMLTAMIGFCDLLLAKHQAGDPSFADIMQIKQNANRAANLVRHLLAFSRQQTLRPSVLWLPDTLANLKDLLKRLVGENVTLEIKHDRDVGLVKVDEGQFEQAIINLCVNARDAMPDGGGVTIRTENISTEQSEKLGHALMPAAEYVMIEVADTGTGIAKEDLGKIFEPFFTTKEVGQGTGLGLSMVYGVVKQTGGFIFPESTVGKGTAFKIYLPLHVETEQEKAADTAQAETAKPDLTGMGKILLVEDEEAVRTFASRALSTRGYTVLEAPSGDIALDLMKEQGGEIDLVVSDVVMPGMRGPTMVQESRQYCPDAKIIFISGYTEDAFQKNLDPDLEFAFLPKPFSLKQLAEKVKEVMQAGG